MRFVFCLGLLLVGLCLSAQKHDYVWVTGDDNENFDSIAGYGGSLLDFNYTPVKGSPRQRELNMYTCNASVCDSAGNLLFYTNGCTIAGADDVILENGDNLNPGPFHNLWCIQSEEGYNSGVQSALILPLPGNDKVYYLFHQQFRMVTTPSLFGYTDKLLYSVVDFSSSKHGVVTQKNIPVVEDTLTSGELVAVKHANGRDWWLVSSRQFGNHFFIHKFTENGIVDTIEQIVGSPLITPQYKGLGQMVFSPDGRKIYRVNQYNPVLVYDFDRETGMITGFDTISFDYGNQLLGEVGCAVSPNGRYLYLSCREYLYQLDLLADDISASQTTVAEYDGFTEPFPTIFLFSQLAPDCKIYIMAGGDTRYYHIIHDPDQPGTACNVEQRGLLLPTRSGASMPFPPNYRLGPSDAPGLPCSPTVSAGGGVLPRAPALSVRPNPARDLLYISASGEADLNFQLYNAAGLPLRSLVLPAAGGQQTLDVSALPPGIYWYRAWDTEGRVQTGKVVIGH